MSTAAAAEAVARVKSAAGKGGDGSSVGREGGGSSSGSGSGSGGSGSGGIADGNSGGDDGDGGGSGDSGGDRRGTRRGRESLSESDPALLEDQAGHKMMCGLGWREGGGLGRDG